MAQYWIQTPVENAKEVVQRYLDANSGTLTAYAGATVSYDDQCEVVFYGTDLEGFGIPSGNEIYFGTFILNQSLSNPTRIILVDSQSNEINITDWDNNIPSPGKYPFIIWNYSSNGWFAGDGYFIGYKFNITTP